MNGAHDGRETELIPAQEAPHDGRVIELNNNSFFHIYNPLPLSLTSWKALALPWYITELS